MSSIKLALIGAGFIAEEHLKAIDAVEDLEVDLIYSRTSSKANSLSKKFSILEVVNDKDSFLSLAKKRDGILVTVSAENMFEVCTELLPLKIPLFIEKPPALSLEEMDTLVQTSINYNTLNMVGFNRRFYSIFHKGLEIINDYGGLVAIAKSSITTAQNTNFAVKSSILKIFLESNGIKFYNNENKKTKSTIELSKKLDATTIQIFCYNTKTVWRKILPNELISSNASLLLE